jgi:lysosomal alpha-mannosidase
MEFWWSPRQDSGEDNSLLGILNYNGYSPPPGFCFDIYCNDNPVMYNPKLENYNLPQMAVEFAEYFRDMSQHYRQPILQFCMGMDFFYLNADIWYKNLDLLIDYINQHPELFNMEFIYSTPADYLKDINDYGARYPNNRYDFMPYADNADSYWTGYFTSRVADKGQVRYTGRWFQSVRTYLAALRLNDASTLSEQLENEIDTSLFVQEEALAIL